MCFGFSGIKIDGGGGWGGGGKKAPQKGGGLGLFFVRKKRLKPHNTPNNFIFSLCILIRKKPHYNGKKKILG